MSGCVEFESSSSMTGSTRTGPLKPQVDSAPLKNDKTITSSSSSATSTSSIVDSSSGLSRTNDQPDISSSPHRQRSTRTRHKMTPVRPPSGQPIQLTPLWEHVVRTRRFPSEVDTRETFDEITERLRDPEWEVRQHALRVLVDVLPTLDPTIVDDVMTPVLPELVDNLGHLAPAVRKGALDTLRVYLVCSRKREDIVGGILDEGLNRSDSLDNFQTNVSLGVILSTPSLLFPSSASPRPSDEILRRAIGVLATRLIQVTHQEASVRSLVKIHELLGTEEFDVYLNELDMNAKRDYEVLCDVYKIKPSERNSRRKSVRSKKQEVLVADRRTIEESKKDSEERQVVEKNCNCENEREPNENIEKTIDTLMPPGRIVLETEIKFNEETAITMTILEGKDEASDEESDFESDDEFSRGKEEEVAIGKEDDREEVKDETVKDEWIERRKTPRRVHFGGEIVKLRTPDSDDSEHVQTEILQTRIPIPISPSAKIQAVRSRKSRSNPCSPNLARSRLRASKSVTNSPKREFYTHDASLSPKKSILTRTGNNITETSDEWKKSIEGRVDELFGERENDSGWTFEIFDNDDFLDSNVEKIVTTKNSTNSTIDSSNMTNNRESSKKKRNSTKTSDETVKNNEIDENEITTDKILDDVRLDLSSKKDEIRKNTASPTDSRENTKIKHNFAKANGELLTRNNEIGKIGTNEESVEVERVELVKGSRIPLESSYDTFQDKQERAKELRGFIVATTSERIPFADKETREVEEKLDVPSSTADFHRRSSPLSPKKLAFETFPRKERNYILMELSSPVKAKSTRQNDASNEEERNDTEEERGHDRLSENNSSLSRGNSPMDSSVDHLFVDRNENSIERIVDTKGDKNYVEVEDSTLVNNVEKNNRKDGTNETYEEVKKVEMSFDIDENPLPDIVIAETTKYRESNWEELGLVDQQVLDDLHNKDDWRARVRGLERVASALRTSSALIAIESRLGSLLQAVLGGERSCRVAAAGMAVARVVVAGVSEEALKRRLPQVAWGLARQGGPNAAQLARVAMLRLRPALLLEQLLQPHCIKARNAKTRENALQLLIFSLVTFPSTEFKVENVAYKVASMVGDRRRRVRQAALDTLAVLAQIYEPEEVTKAGKLAAKGQQDGDAMLAAIKARLARKSLPMVSADGLVVYGLQISPTVQIATGPDVDWIVAGSGSVSPGTGRTRGQIIATTTRQGVQEKNAKNESVKNIPRTKGPNFVALGIGLETKNDHHKPLAWQLVQHSAQEETRNQEKWSADNRNENSIGGKRLVEKSRLTGTLRQYRSASDRLDDTFVTDEPTPVFLLDDKDVLMKQRKTEENFHRRMDEIYAERSGNVPTSQDITGNRLESRIPVPQSRDREMNAKETRIGTSYTRKRLAQEGNNLQNWSAGSRVSDISRPHSTQRDDQTRKDTSVQRYQRTDSENSPRCLSPTRDAYRSIYRQRRGYADGNVYREVQTAPTTTSYDVTRRRQSLKDTSRHVQDNRRIVSTEQQTLRMNDETRSRRLVNDDLYGLGNSTFCNGDKSTIDEEDYNEINKRHFSVQANSYAIQNSNERSAQCPDRPNNGPSETWSNGSSNVSGEDGTLENLEKTEDDRKSSDESLVVGNDGGIRASPTKSPMIEKSFDVITHETNPSRRNSIDYGIASRNVYPSGIVYTTDLVNEEEYGTDKDSSVEEVAIFPRVHSRQENFADCRVYEIDSSEIEETTRRDIDRNIASPRLYETSDAKFSDVAITKVSDDSVGSNESQEMDVESLNPSTSPARVESYAKSAFETVGFENSRSSTDENDETDAINTFVLEYPQDLPLENVRREVSPRIDVDSPARGEIFSSRRSRERSNSRDENDDENVSTGNIITVLVASRPQSRDPGQDASSQTLESRRNSRRESSVVEKSIVVKTRENSRSPTEEPDDSSNESNFNDRLPVGNPPVTQDFSRDSTNSGKINRSSNARNDSPIKLPEVNGAQASTSEKNEGQKRVVPSRVPRIRQRTRSNVARVAPILVSEKNTTRSKPMTQQCFAQLESNEWEIAIKGLKGLSQIAREQPEQLDTCAPGIIGRLLGRHVRNLRSQVSRAACLAAGDVFGSQARFIDQDLDDIAGPLLHRTADTNKFLRADSNEALDRMVEHLPPNKTIGVIVHRGATHQNAIVRATTARLLASIVDRFGPDWTMSLPRDSREKLIATGAKLLMDGNLDSRNHAKAMFRKLSRCEGFRKTLKDSVPEATLRHLDKTLKSL